MKNFVIIIIIILNKSVCFSQNSDSSKVNCIKANLNVGVGTNFYKLNYSFQDTLDFNNIIDQSYQKQFYLMSFGFSLNLKEFQFMTDIVNLKMLRLNLGYNVFSLFKKIKDIHKLKVQFCYSLLSSNKWSWSRKSYSAKWIKEHPDAFFPYPYSTNLIGGSISYQYKKFEIYYNFMKYRRLITLNSTEYQHIIGIKYNIFKEKE